MTLKLISIVVPTHNEMANVEVLYRRIASVFEKLTGYDFELIFCDDSTDTTPLEIARINELDRRVKLIRLSRRFSQAIAISAGIDRCAGGAAILMDADLQDPPEVIPQLIELWKLATKLSTCNVPALQIMWRTSFCLTSSTACCTASLR